MQSALETFLVANVFAFLVTFVRLSAAIMIMPGVGDSFTPNNVRLIFALAMSMVLFPVVMPYMPDTIPSGAGLFVMLSIEFVIGLFIGTIARVFMSALDIAGMIVSIQSGLGNAQLFNPTIATQGSLIGAFFSITGVAILLATNMHHLLFAGLMDSYFFFPIGGVPDVGSMAELFSKAVSVSFGIGMKIAAPFIIIALVLYAGMGVLTRVMPQVQVFLLVLPLQIMLALMTIAVVMSAGFLFWAREFEAAMTYFLTAVSP